MILIPQLIGGYVIAILITLLFYVVLAQSWAIFSGYSGYISLGTVAFVGIGAYTLMFLQYFPIYLSVLIAGGVGGAIAAGIGLPSLRVRGPYFAILSFGIAEVLRNIVLQLDMITVNRPGRFLYIDLPSIETIYYSLLVLTIVLVIVAYLIKRSNLGLGLFVISDDEDAAAASGVDTTRYKLTAFVISAVFASLLGAIMALRLGYIEPHVVFNPFISFHAIIAASLGGARKVRGPILGAIVITLLSEYLSTMFVFHYYIILGVILILIVRFYPSGLAPLTQPLERILTSKMRITHKGASQNK